MKQHYFVVVLAHSPHGRLRRIHGPHQALCVVWRWRCLPNFSGWFRSYLRMSWKVQLLMPCGSLTRCATATAVAAGQH
jgi:hypothetical protein